jgi:hypothetical protein
MSRYCSGRHPKVYLTGGIFPRRSSGTKVPLDRRTGAPLRDQAEFPCSGESLGAAVCLTARRVASFPFP